MPPVFIAWLTQFDYIAFILTNRHIHFSLLQGAACVGQVAYGEESLPTNGRENVAQKYLSLQTDDHALTVFNDGVYGSSCEGESLYMTLVRSAAYAAHPIGDRELIEQDRFIPHMDQGERCYRFLISAGTLAEQAERGANGDVFNERPMALSFYPSVRESAAVRR